MPWTRRSRRSGPESKAAVITADVVVVGGGIVGLATARALATAHGARVIVLEAEARVAAHQTGHNSGVMHSGVYYKPGSLKARLCRTGLAAMYEFCAAEGVPHRRCGKLIVAVDESEERRLVALEERARANGSPVRRVDRAEIRTIEPAVAGTAGLWVEDTGVVSYAAVCQALVRDLERRGGDVRTGARVLGITRRGAGHGVATTAGAFEGARLVTCAGLQADRVARMAGLEPAVRIVPFRGEYYHLRRPELVRGLIYPVPDPELPFLGVHFTRGVDDTVEAGPNAVLALGRESYRWSDINPADVLDLVTYGGFWRLAAAHWRTGLSEVARSWSTARFVASLQRLVPGVTAADLVAGGSGVRAQAVDPSGRLVDDFVLQEADGAMHVLNAPSPAATASLVIGSEVAARLMGRPAA